ncbi:MAG: hypothetical protein WA842_04645 [Croceibacterium sp.]
MTSTPRNPAEAPEDHNSEQDDEAAQAQTLAQQALAGGRSTSSPLDSTKDDNDSGLMDDSTQDLVDHMRDMEQSGRIDMGAYHGEPNHDDEDDTYGTDRHEDSE